MNIDSIDGQIDSNGHRKILYKSHIQQKSNGDIKVYFRCNNHIYSQGDDDLVYPLTTTHFEDVRYISVRISTKKAILDFDKVDDFIYNNKDLIEMHKKHLKYLNPKRFEILQNQIKEQDKIRDATESRK